MTPEANVSSEPVLGPRLPLTQADTDRSLFDYIEVVL